MSHHQIERISGIFVVVASTLLGMYSFIYPFLIPNLSQSASPAAIRATESPIMFVLILGISVIGLLSEAQLGASSARMVALAGMLIAANSVLRFIEVAIPGPGGFSPIFFLIILSGYTFGAQFGFLIGALTLFVSALITGGVGPWLPSQMFTAGWVGMSAAFLAPLSKKLGWEGKNGEIGLLLFWGAVWGLLYGAIMNLWSWPFLSGSPDQYWQPGLNWQATLQRYGVFYLATSLVWDLSRSLGNVLFIGLFGKGTLRILRRFKRRFVFLVEQPISVPSKTDVNSKDKGEANAAHA